MSLSKLGSQCRRTLKHVHKHQQCRINNDKIVPDLGIVRNLATDGSKDPKIERVPKAGVYRSPWAILKEEFEGITTMKPAQTEVPRETDVLIIGGGIVGSSVAYWMKQLNPAGNTVTIIERDPVYTRSSSMLSWAGVRHQFSVPENVRLSLCTSEFLCNIKQNLGVLHEKPPDVQFNHQGYLILAQEKDAEQLAENVDMQTELGARVVLLTKKQLSEKYPWMDLEGIECGSLGLEGEGWLDPWSLLRALKQKNISLGTKYINGELIGFEAEAMDPSGVTKQSKLESAVTRLKDGREFGTKFAMVVNCAGPWASDIAELAGIGVGEDDLAYPLPVIPRYDSNNERKDTWQHPLLLHEKLNGDAGNHELNDAFSRVINLTVSKEEEEDTTRKRNVFVTHCPKGPTLDCPFVIDPSGLFFRREGYGGHYICGHIPTSEDEEPPIGNFDVDLHLYDEKVLPELTKRAPCFHQSSLQTGWAGYSDYNIFDQNPVVGPHPSIINFFFATGFNGHGVQHALGVGRAIQEFIYDRSYTTIDMSKFHFSRFLKNAPIKEKLFLG